MYLKLGHMLKYRSMVFFFFGPLDLVVRPSSKKTYFCMYNTFGLVKKRGLESLGLIFNKICFCLVLSLSCHEFFSGSRVGVAGGLFPSSLPSLCSTCGRGRKMGRGKKVCHVSYGCSLHRSSGKLAYFSNEANRCT